MLIERINRTDAEKVFLVVFNQYAQSLTTGMACRYLGALAAETVSTDGAQVTALAATADMCQFAGIAAQDIGTVSYGRVQAWGYCNSIMLSYTNTSVTVGTHARLESFLGFQAVAGMLGSGVAPETLSTAMYKYVQNCLTTNLSSNAANTQPFVWTSGFVRAL